MSASWEMPGPQALPSIHGRIKSGCSWKVGSQPEVSGEGPLEYLEGRSSIDATDASPWILCVLGLMRRHGFCVSCYGLRRRGVTLVWAGPSVNGHREGKGLFWAGWFVSKLKWAASCMCGASM
jgi:hypothetical protein